MVLAFLITALSGCAPSADEQTQIPSMKLTGEPAVTVALSDAWIGLITESEAILFDRTKPLIPTHIRHYPGIKPTTAGLSASSLYAAGVGGMYSLELSGKGVSSVFAAESEGFVLEPFLAKVDAAGSRAVVGSRREWSKSDPKVIEVRSPALFDIASKRESEVRFRTDHFLSNVHLLSAGYIGQFEQDSGELVIRDQQQLVKTRIACPKPTHVVTDDDGRHAFVTDGRRLYVYDLLTAGKVFDVADVASEGVCYVNDSLFVLRLEPNSWAAKSVDIMDPTSGKVHESVPCNVEGEAVGMAVHDTVFVVITTKGAFLFQRS